MTMAPPSTSCLNETTTTRCITNRKSSRIRSVSYGSLVWLLLALPLSHSFLPSSARRRPTFVSRRASADDNNDGIGVGVDLGTTYSAVAILVDGIPTIVPVPNNGRTVPSVVSFDEDGNFVVGKEAIEMEVHNPLGSYRNVKRILGTGGRIASENAEVVPNVVIERWSGDDGSKKKKMKKRKKRPKTDSLAKQLQQAQENPALLYLPPKDNETTRETIAPEVISAQVLQTLFQAVQQQTQQPVTRAVVGVPAYFNDAQREATIRACHLAGVEKVKLLREPEAAALAYGIGKEQIGAGDEDELVLVFDLGGGTYDVSMLVVGGGLTEVVCTSGNVKLGGSDFDARIAEYFAKLLVNHGATRNYVSEGGEAADAMIRAAEAVRIYLSNNRKVSLALPLEKEAWSSMPHAGDVITPFSDAGELTADGTSNSTHVLCELSRKTMEGLCRKEFEALVRPLREVAIMSGAMLPGDARPSVVEAAFEMEEELERALREAKDGSPIVFEDFYNDEEGKELAASATVASPSEVADVDPDMLLELQELDMKERKRAQQKGRKKARNVAKRERKFREEKRKVDTSVDDKVLDGISGRPISQVVLVGGATRMPAIGRLLAALTGVVPQRTVNPDEAVATGCAVQVGVLDGSEELGGLTVLTPMQAAIMRAVAEKEGLFDVDDDFDDEEFDTVEIF
jgi:molecular chaperone DnaK (HSP70)